MRHILLILCGVCSLVWHSYMLKKKIFFKYWIKKKSVLGLPIYHYYYLNPLWKQFFLQSVTRRLYILLKNLLQSVTNRESVTNFNLIITKCDKNLLQSDYRDYKVWQLLQSQPQPDKMHVMKLPYCKNLGLLFTTCSPV